MVSLRNESDLPVAASPSHCFAAGTRILTAHGEVPVQEIKVGDEVVTVRVAGVYTRKVIWTGCRATNIARHPEPAEVAPVRIMAGAFGPGLPERDLRVSPKHGVFIDGSLFEAVSLVNGFTVFQERNTAQVSYHHIEFAAHDIVLAEGLAMESYLDAGGRDSFDTSPGVVRLHPDFGHIAGQGHCAELVLDGPLLDAARMRLAAVAAELGVIVTAEEVAA